MSQQKNAKIVGMKRNTLAICNWNDGTISKKKMYKKLIKNKPCFCGKPVTSAYFEFNEFGKYDKGKCRVCMWKNTSLLILIHLTLGFSSPQQENLKLLDSLLSVKYSIGGFIGSKTFAYYLIGSTTTNLLFLDPHFVQNSDFYVNEESVKTYRFDSIKEINKMNVSTSVSLGFLVHSEKEQEEFWGTLKQLKNHLGDDFYLDILELADQENDSEDDKIFEEVVPTKSLISKK